MSATGPTATRFEPGARPPDGTIPLCVPEIRGHELQYVRDCLEGNWVSSVGPDVDRLEQMVAAYVGSKHAVATVNGTAALHVALLIAGVQPDDEVLVPTLTFIAPANAVRYVGAWPVFMDAEPTYWQMDPQKVADFLEMGCRWSRGGLWNRTTGRRIKAVLPVHLLGHPADLDPLLQATRKYDLAVVEDATECLGARYKGRMVGRESDVACFSFNGNKVITMGGGGMIVTDNDAWAGRAKYLTTQAKDDPIEYVHNEIGYNYRLTNIQAAVGRAQMEQLDTYIATKRRIAAGYSEAFRNVPGLTPMSEAPWACSIFWLYTLLVDEARYGEDSRALLHRLGQAGIQSRPLWQPMHRSPAHGGSMGYHIEVADRIHERALSLPSSVGLSPTDQHRVISMVQDGDNNCGVSPGGRRGYPSGTSPDATCVNCCPIFPSL